MKHKHLTSVLRIHITLTVILFLIICQFSAYSQPNTRDVIPEKTNNEKRIHGLLKNLKHKANFEKMFFLVNDKGVEHYTEKLKNLKPEDDEILIRYKLAEQLLLSGNSESAKNELEKLLPLAREKDNAKLGSNMGLEVLRLLAMAYFRMGEQANCIIDHNSESCIYPIKGKGIYKFKDATRQSIKVFNQVMIENPLDYESMWVMNVAYMTLGIYPDSVPKQYFIPYNTFDETKGSPKFTDIAPDLGFTSTGLAGSVIMDDFDNDGDYDLFLTSESYDQAVRYYENTGNNGFVDRTLSAGLSKQIGGRICQQADYNNDGFLDVFVIRGGWQVQEDNFPPNSLLKNNGNGTFTDVSIEAGLLSFMPTSSAAWGDYDNDGWLDLFLSVESQDPTLDHPCRLYHNNKDGTFNDVASEVGIHVVGFMKGSVWEDFNNDGFQDLYISNYKGRNVLLINTKDNNGKFYFTDMGREAGVQQPMSGIGCLAFDFDNDGWVDIFAPSSTLGPKNDAVTQDYLYKNPNFESTPRFYKNEKNGKFKDITNEVGLTRAVYAMGMNYGDIDNDGFLDMYIGTGFLDFRSIYPNLMFRNDNGKLFLDVSNASGTGNLQKGHGISFGDIDSDGDQDIFQVLGGGFTGDIYQNALYENNGNSNHWISLSLEGTKSNKSAIGTKVKITVETPDGIRDIYKTVSSGGPFGASPLRCEIGLGNAVAIKNIEIFWPATKLKQMFTNVKFDTHYKLYEGSDKIVQVPLNKIDFTKVEKNSHQKPH